MRNLSKNALIGICVEAGVTHYSTKDGVEIRVGNKKMGTFISIEDGRSSRFVYPKGSEYTHTSYFNQPLTEEMILKAKVNYAMDRIRESI